MKSLKPVNSVFTDYVLARSYKHLSLQIFILSLKKKSQKGGKSTSVHRVMQANFKKKKSCIALLVAKNKSLVLKFFC